MTMQTLALAFAETDLELWESRYVVNAKEPLAIEAGNAAKARGQLSRDEFLLIADWKSARPRRFYEMNEAAQVAEVSARAFASAHDLERVLLLTELSGVKVRTATALLHLSHPQPYPMLDVWAMTAFGMPREATERWDELDWLRIWPAYVRACRQIAGRAGHATHDDFRKMDRALWAYGESVGSNRRSATDRHLPINVIE